MNASHKLIRMSIVGLAGVLIVIIAIRVGMNLKKPQPFPAAETGSYGTVDSFTFTNEEGKPFGLADLKGSLWIADFIFTRCMGPCPLVTTRMAQLQSDFSQLPHVNLVTFSVDPEFDQPAVMKKYAASYGAQTNRWHFLTGKKADVIGFIRKSFHLAVEPTQEDNQIIHSLSFVLVDSQGTIRGYYNSTDAEAVGRLKAEVQFLAGQLGNK